MSDSADLTPAAGTPSDRPQSDPTLGRARTRGWGNWIALVAWMVAIYVFSDQPDLPAVHGPWMDFAIKKLLHAAGYGVLAGLWWRALAGAGLRRPFAWAFVLTVTYAFSDEWHQTLVPGRTGRLRDVAIDAAGALIALAWLRGRTRRVGRSQ